ncbi:MAG: hypothetical protein BWK76_10965 [Desulfobulbaceae bacterium A2]|nr:MAG: hypothetical protein BWK76_10965 [Desulfobulbaceae bacterium A2]
MISWPARISEKDINPALYLASGALVYVFLLFSPQWLWFNVIILLFLATWFVVKPRQGVAFIVYCYPVMSCGYYMLWSIGMPYDFVVSLNVPEVETSVAPLENKVTFLQFQVVSMLLLPSILFYLRGFFFKVTVNRTLIYILFFFFIWCLWVAYISRMPDKSIFGLSRFASVVILSLFITIFITNLADIRRLMVAHCCAALVLSFFAYYGTYYGFEDVSHIFIVRSLKIIQFQSLFNGANTFKADIQGMLPGFGLSGKHEFSTFVAAGFFFSLYLAVTTPRKSFRLFYFIACMVLFTDLFYAPSKLTIVGVIFGSLLTAVLIPGLRKNIAIIAFVIIAFLIVALTVSQFLRPPHEKKMSGMTRNFTVVNDSSEFSQKSFKARLAIMRQALDHAKKTHLLGIGPDMLQRDHIFTHVHGHNLFITLLVEYGAPALLCVIILGILLVRRVTRLLLTPGRRFNPEFLALLSITSAFIAIFFEHNFDCFVWTPHLWIIGTLLWITAHIVYQKDSSQAWSRPL